MIEWTEYYHYAIAIILMMTGLYVVFASSNMIKKLVGLSLFQTSVFLLYITIGKATGAQPPILVDDATADILYANPLPHVLILTAIVVGVATLAIGLALIVRIRETYGTVEEADIDDLNHAQYAQIAEEK